MADDSQNADFIASILLRPISQWKSEDGKSFYTELAPNDADRFQRLKRSGLLGSMENKYGVEVHLQRLYSLDDLTEAWLTEEPKALNKSSKPISKALRIEVSEADFQKLYEIAARKENALLRVAVLKNELPGLGWELTEPSLPETSGATLAVNLEGHPLRDDFFQFQGQLRNSLDIDSFNVTRSGPDAEIHATIGQKDLDKVVKKNKRKNAPAPSIDGNLENKDLLYDLEVLKTELQRRFELLVKYASGSKEFTLTTLGKQFKNITRAQRELLGITEPLPTFNRHIGDIIYRDAPVSASFLRAFDYVFEQRLDKRHAPSNEYEGCRPLAMIFSDGDIVKPQVKAGAVETPKRTVKGGEANYVLVPLEKRREPGLEHLHDHDRLWEYGFHFGHLVRAVRLKSGESLKDFSMHAGVSVELLTAIENNDVEKFMKPRDKLEEYRKIFIYAQESAGKEWFDSAKQVKFIRFAYPNPKAVERQMFFIDDKVQQILASEKESQSKRGR